MSRTIAKQAMVIECCGRRKYTEVCGDVDAEMNTAECVLRG